MSQSANPTPVALTIKQDRSPITRLAMATTMVLLLSSCSLILGSGSERDTAADADVGEESGQRPDQDGSEDSSAAPEDQSGAKQEPSDATGEDAGADHDAGAQTAAIEDAPTIQESDFAALEWREAVNEFYVIPAEDDGLQTITIGEQIAYADVDGDGHDDALVPLQISDGNWFEQIWYIWTWDPQSEAPVQVESPVAREARCGDAVRDVGAEGAAFVISEALRIQGDTSLDCASEGPIEITRHVTLDDGWPVLTGGLTGDGGICPQPNGTDSMFPVGDADLRVAPYDDASPVTEAAPDAFDEVEDVWSHLWLYREHWMLVHLGYYDQNVTGGYIPCAWIYLEEDTRPIPHAPYQEG